MPRPKGSKNKKTAVVIDTVENIDEKVAAVEAAIASLTEELKKEIQNYVKEHTAPYKYPRKIVFREELPKTISGKIQRNLL